MTIAQQVQFQLSALGVPAPVATATLYSPPDVLNPCVIGGNLSDDFLPSAHPGLRGEILSPTRLLACASNIDGHFIQGRAA